MKKHSAIIKAFLLAIFIFNSNSYSFAQMANLLWAERFGGTLNESATAMAIDNQGNVYMAGWYNDTAPVPFGNYTLTNTAKVGFFLVKMDSTGKVLWAKNAGNGNGNNEPQGLAVDASGNIIMTGFFGSEVFTVGNDTVYNTGGIADSNGYLDNVFISKFDTGGKVLWVKGFGTTGDALANSVTVDPFGNAYITGDFGGDTLTFGHTTINVTSLFGGGTFTVKFDPLGNVVWAQGSKASGSLSIAYSPSGAIYTTGYFSQDTLIVGGDTLFDPRGGALIFVIQYDTLGNVLWARDAGDDSDYQYGYGITADAGGNAYVTGAFHGPHIQFGNTTFVNDSFGNGDDMFLTKYDTSGNVVWARHAGGKGDDLGWALVTDAATNIYLTGYYFSTTFNFQGTTDTLIHNSGGFVVFVAKYDSSGTLLWDNSAQGEADQYCYGIVTDGLGNAYVDGSFLGNYMGFDSIVVNTGKLDSAYLSNAYSLGTTSDIFIAKFGTFQATGVPVTNNPGQIIFPNPTTGNINILGLPVHSNIQIFDLTGRLLMNQETADENITLDLSAYAPGVYILNTSEGAQKIVKIE